MPTQFLQDIATELNLSTSKSSSNDTGMSAQIDDRSPNCEPPGRNINGTDFNPGDTAWFFTKEPKNATGHRVVYCQKGSAAYPLGSETIRITDEIVKFTDSKTAQLANVCVGSPNIKESGTPTVGTVKFDASEESDGKTLIAATKGYGVFLVSYDTEITLGNYTFPSNIPRGESVLLVLGASVPGENPCVQK